MFRFEQHSNTKLFLAAEETGACVMGYYLIEDHRENNEGDPSKINLQDSWESCIGYYLFFNIKEIPENHDIFADAIIAFLSEKSTPDHTSFLWLIYDDRFIESPVTEIDVIETKSDETDEENPNVVLVKEVLLNFGGYYLPFGKDTPVVLQQSGEDYAGFIFQYPPEPPNVCPSDAKLPLPTDGVHLAFTGNRRGCFECKCLIGDYYSQEDTSWHVGLRYAVQLGSNVRHQFYPVFDLYDGRRPILNMCWDLADHLNPNRTFLEFLGQSIELVLTGKECGLRMMIPNHPEILASYFRTVTGEVIGLIPQTDDEQPARLVFEVWEDATPQTPSRYYLVPSGKFELVLIEIDEDNGYAFEPITSADLKAEFPSRLMCGMSGIESVQFMPRDEDKDGENIPGESIVFFPHQPAYVPKFPVSGASGEQIPSRDDLDLIKNKYQTAWVGFASEQSSLPYFSQPETAPLHTSQDNDPNDQLLSLFEPIAAPLERSDDEHCFPIAPIAGATPMTGVPEPKVTFLKNLEAQIVGPWRREVIRQLFNKSVGNTPGATEITAVTPQGLKAKVKGETWTELMLAHPKGTNSILKLSDLDSTLKAAFQSNQLFLVATEGTHFQKFDSLVKIGVWEFDLHPNKNQRGKLNNVIIFKFSPGKLRDRLQDPRSWTNPASFNRTDGDALSTLTTQLSEFIKGVDAFFAGGNENESEEEKKNREKKMADYGPLHEILDDEGWTGVLGLNLYLNIRSLPRELKALSAGIEPEKFFAHHLAIEAGTIDYEPGALPEPTECSLFGLIDCETGSQANQRPGQPADFTVTRLRGVFRNGELAEFGCEARLTINELFGQKVEPVKTITLIGARERREGSDAYSLTIDSNESEPARLNNSPAIKSVEMRKAELQVTEVGATNTIVSLIFSFSGAVSFHALKNGAFDLFSYDRIPYTGLIVRMDFLESKPAERNLRIDLSGFSLDGNPTAVTVRSDSLIKKFPMKLQRFYSSSSGTTPSNDGYIAVTTVISDDKDLSNQIYGLDFTLNLGTLGDFAANAGINVNLLLAWSAEKVKVFLKIPGVSGASTELFSLQGVVKLEANRYELVYLDDVRSWVLILNQMALRILGVGFPLWNKPNLFIFGPPQAGAADMPLGWYAAYNKPKPNP